MKCVGPPGASRVKIKKLKKKIYKTKTNLKVFQGNSEVYTTAKSNNEIQFKSKIESSTLVSD